MLRVTVDISSPQGNDNHHIIWYLITNVIATLVDMIVHYGMHHIVYAIQCYNGEDDRPLSHIRLDSLHV